MPSETPRPDLAVMVPLDPHAPRSARHCVAQVDNPSPDLRDAVVLLCSELVTQAVEHSEGGAIELRVWMPQDVVRVEVHGNPETVSHSPREASGYAALLLDQIADRWDQEATAEESQVWFEIDRHPAGVRFARGR
jgi:hypothetical protein